MNQIQRKFKKFIRLAQNSEFRRGLLQKVPAAIEHQEILNRYPCATLLDIGANRGQFSLLVRGLYPSSIIHAFEPLKSAGAVYAQLFDGHENVHLHPMAAGSAPGEADINITAKNDSSSLLGITGVKTIFADSGTHQIGTEPVRVDRVDVELANVTMQRPVMCKLDVQGFELEALRGCEGLMDQIDFFYVECATIELYAGQPTSFEIVSYLHERGFDWRCIGHVSGSPAEPGVIADLLFVRRGTKFGGVQA